MILEAFSIRKCLGMAEGCWKMHEIWSFILTWWKWKHSDVKSWFVSSFSAIWPTGRKAVGCTIDLRPRCQSCVSMKAASKWALANPRGGFLQSLRSPNHEPLLWPSSFPLSCRSHQNRSSSWAFLLWPSQCSCLGIYSACQEKSRTIMRKTASTTQAPH